MQLSMQINMLVSCFVIQGCCIVVLILIVFETFQSADHKLVFPLDVSAESKFSPEHYMNKGIFKDVGNDIGNIISTGNFVTSNVDTVSTNKFLILQNATGRLGNQMFDFASAVGIAHLLNYRFVMKTPHPLLTYFELNQPMTKRIENVKQIPILEWRTNTWNKTYLSYNLTLRKCWRSWTYFDSVGDKIRKAFTIKTEYLNAAKTFLKSQNPDNKTLVGVHVRRGDFLTDEQTKRGRVVVNKQYLEKAMHFFRIRYKDVMFVVVSNDKGWCRDNIVGNDVVFSNFTKAIHDMALLSLCNDTIMSTGTFGWWGAWLAGGTVVYCSDYPRPGSYVANHSLFRDNFYPPSWIGMSNGI